MSRSGRFPLPLSTAVIAAFFLAPAAAPAQEKGRKVALLVGVDKYEESTGLRNLSYSEKDVTDLAGVLEKLGYEVTLLTRAEWKKRDRDFLLPDAKNIRDHLAGVVRGGRPADTVLVAFSGHGAHLKTTNKLYFCPSRTDLGDEKTLIAVDDVLAALEGCTAGSKIFLFDACRNDPADGNTGGVPGELKSSTRPLVPHPKGGTVALFSCSTGEKAYESNDLKRGFMMHFVIEGLSAKAANRDGEVTWLGLAAFVTEEVPRAVRREKGPKVEQTPEALGKSRGMTLARYDQGKWSESGLPPIPLGPDVVPKSAGIGVRLRRDVVRDGLRVTTPTKDGPAYKAGIRAGDLIAEVRVEVDDAGKPLPPGARRVFSTKGMKVEEAEGLLSGLADTSVEIVVAREGVADPLVIKVRRHFVPSETVLGVRRKPNDDWEFHLDERYGIAYVRLPRFASVDLNGDSVEDVGTFTSLKNTLAGLRKSGLNGLVLDLRSTADGPLFSAVTVGSLFVGKELIATVRGGSGATSMRGAIPGDPSFPVVVLVNAATAGSAEVVAACLQDHGRATVIGERTAGHARVAATTPGQSPALWYSASGRNIDRRAAEIDPRIKDWGVKPEAGFEVKFTAEELKGWLVNAADMEAIPPPGRPGAETDPAKDRQLAKGLEYLRGVIKGNGRGPKE